MWKMYKRCLGTLGIVLTLMAPSWAVEISNIVDVEPVIPLLEGVQVMDADYSEYYVLNPDLAKELHVKYKGNDNLALEESNSDVRIEADMELTVSGQVTDEANEALIGVNVQIKGTGVGTATDFDGNYSLPDVDENAILVFSYIGYQTLEVPVAGNSNISIQLVSDSELLDEIVVVGYGTQKKSDLTGAVASIGSSEIDRVIPVKSAKAIQGQVAGVNVQKTSGRPGAGYNLNIRGLNSINFSNSPLVVIDGVIGGDMNVLNPTDIKTIDVLKDASATAIYGSRGANGVIIITTKRGNSGVPTISYNGYVGVKTPAHLPDLQTAQEFYKAGWTDLALNGFTPRYTLTSTETNQVESGQSTDWVDLVTDPSLQTNHSLAIGGGSEHVNYHFSAGYLNEGGSLLDTKYERYNIKGSMESKLNNIVNVGFNINYSYSKSNFGSNEAIRSAYRARPTGVVYYDDILNPDENQDVNWNGYAVWMGINDKQVLNPLVEAHPDNFRDETRSNTLFGNVFLEVTPFKGFSVKTQLSVNDFTSRFGQYRGTFTKSQKATNNPRAYSNHVRSSNYTLDNIITYKNSFGKHDLSFTGLQSAYQTRTESLNSYVNNLPYASLWYAMGTSSTIDNFETNLIEQSLLSFMGRIMYGYNNKYLVTVTNRWDGASQLSPGNKWDFFPSAAVAWRLSEEDFIKDINNVSSMKLRVSYGYVGNSAVGAYSTQSRLSKTDYDFNGAAAFGFAPANLADKSLKWEKSRELNVGFDLGFFSNRVSTSIEFYNRNTVDLIYKEQLPNSTGFGSVSTNVGQVANTGVELTLNTVNITNQRFSWRTNFNFSTNKNKIVSLGDGIENDIASRLFVGEPLQVNFDYEFDGIWQLDEADLASSYGFAPGGVRVVDQNNDGKISSNDGEDDRIIIGTRQPDWIAGITNRFTFDDFDFSFLIYTNQGVQYYNSMLSGTMGEVGRGRYNALNLNYWTVENPTDDYFPYGVSNPRKSAIFYQDASFVRISDITLGYTLPQKALSKMGMNRFRLYAQVTNPFVFDKFDGLDPEYNTGTYNDDVSSFTFLFGVNLTF